MNEYRTLKQAISAMRENFIAGDLSGFESITDLIEAIRAAESRMFEIVAKAS